MSSIKSRIITNEQYEKAIFKLYDEFNQDFYLKSYFINEENFNKLFDSNCYFNTIDTDFNMIFKKLHTDIIKLCINTYNKISDEYKKDNTDLIMKIVELFNNYLIYTYQYYIIVNDYKRFCEFNRDIEKDRSSKRHKTFIPDLFYKYINTYDNNITNFDTYIKYIIYNFNTTVLKIPSKSRYIYILDAYKSNIYNINDVDKDFALPREITDIIKDEELLINYIRVNKNRINAINNISIKLMDKYVTIPQYISNCWFISIITGMTYSDLSRNLLKNKRKLLSNSPYKFFEIFISYIIDNITDIKAEYSVTENSNCDLLKYLKNEPTKIFIELIKIYALNILDKSLLIHDLSIILIKLQNANKQLSILTKDILKTGLIPFAIKDPFGYLIIANLLNSNNYTLTKTGNIEEDSKYDAKQLVDNYITNIDNFTTYKTYGIYNNNNFIVKLFYELLNLKTFYCGINKIGSKYIYYKLLNTDLTIKDPDIILLHTYIDIDTRGFEILPDNFFDNYDKLEIDFNGHKYKLDYMLHNNNQSISCRNCGHCISSIIYHGDEYIYNSDIYSKNIYCDDLKYKYPCGLIKNKWTDKILTNTCYSINTCGYLDINVEKISMKSQHLSSVNICYSFDKEYLLVYIKN